MISIIIPAYNEEKTISNILESIKIAFLNIPYEIIIIDDGSYDNTQTICEEISLNSSDIHYIRLNKNNGKGFALRAGFKEAKGSFVLIQDADNEYDPFVLKNLYNNANKNIVIYGKRNRKKGYLLNRIGNIFITYICNLLYNSNLFDIYTCYKIIPTQILKSLKLTSNGFEIEAEITAKLLRKKIKIIEIPITYNPRTFKEGKHIRAKDGIIGLLTLIKNRF